MLRGLPIPLVLSNRPYIKINDTVKPKRVPHIEKGSGWNNSGKEGALNSKYRAIEAPTMDEIKIKFFPSDKLFSGVTLN